MHRLQLCNIVLIVDNSSHGAFLYTSAFIFIFVYRVYVHVRIYNVHVHVRKYMYMIKILFYAYFLSSGLLKYLELGRCLSDTGCRAGALV